MTLDFIGGVILMAAILVNISVFTNALAVSQTVRIGLVATAGAWTGLQLSLYSAGAYQSDLVREVFPLVGLMVALPMVAVGVAAIVSDRVRAILLAVPMQVLIGLNSMRIFGALFLFLAAAGRLSGPFPYSAGWGDVIAGLVAIPLAIRAANGSAGPAAIFAWNVFAAADLIAAIALGVASSEGSPLQVFASPGSAAVQHLPYLLIPTVLVPFYLITHGIVFAQLRQRRSAATVAEA